MSGMRGSPAHSFFFLPHLEGPERFPRNVNKAAKAVNISYIIHIVTGICWFYEALVLDYATTE